MAQAAMAIAGIGGVVKAAGSVYAGNAAAAAAEYNANMAEQNAAMARQQAASNEHSYRVQARKILGSNRANYGASGITMEGSPLDALQADAATAELDALRIRHGGEVKAIGYQNEATLNRFKGRTAKTAGYLGAAGELLGAGGSAVGMFAGGKK